jgi:hypothetical protein
MSISPIITFKAGKCELDVCIHSFFRREWAIKANCNQTSNRPYKVTPEPTPGYIYLYSEDGIFLINPSAEEDLADTLKTSFTSAGAKEARL